MAVSPAGYAHMTALLATLAGGRLVIALEGGYNLMSISRSAAAVHATLLGDPPPLLERRAPRPEALADIECVVDILRDYWACLRPPTRERHERRAAAGGSVGGGVAKKRKRPKGQKGPWWYRFMYP